VRVVEVGPRDGLQNEARPLPPSVRARFIEGLARAGIPEVEVGSFVSPRWVPQLADTEDVVDRLDAVAGTVYTALVPNVKGLKRAIACGIRSVAVFTAASESFSRRNTNGSIDDNFERFKPVIEMARLESMRVRGYVSTAFACPFEGAISPGRTLAVVLRLLDLGVGEVSIGDTIGVATPRDVERFIEASKGRLDLSRIAFHFHDTYGMAIANVQAALDAGVAVFDSSAGGLGGCPYAPGAAGNLATEDLIYFLESLGIPTGVELGKVVEASTLIERETGHPLPSKVLKAVRAVRERTPGNGSLGCGA
jgi:isopropylmalate/homocitrate/citramalate synthase